MPYTIADFAERRGMTRQGVYNAIERFQIPTYQGKANGKAAQYMTDEDADRLDELLGPTEKSNKILAQNLQLEVANRETALLREKEKEILETRSQMLEKVHSEVGNINQSIERVSDEYASYRSDLDAAHKETVAELQKQIKEKEGRLERSEDEKETYRQWFDNQKQETADEKLRADSLKRELEALKEIEKDKQAHPWRTLFRALRQNSKDRREIKKDGQSTEDTVRECESNDPGDRS